MASDRTGVAQRLAAVVQQVLGRELPVRLRAWDGSEAGPVGAPVAVLRSRRALRRLLWSPNELGLSQAYVTGELDVDGDLADALRHIWNLVRDGELQKPRLRARQLPGLALTAARLGVIGPRPRAPGEEARLTGRKHTRSRDRAVISHHYDLSNEFYELILGPEMAYSSGYWTQEEPAGTPERSQFDKLEMICRKLGLRPGMRLLDVGCGWGSLLLHAAEHHGVHATGATLSRNQQEFISRRVAERGLGASVEVRLQDYRDIDDGPYDAIASIEMGEHVGLEQYPTYAGNLHRLVKPRGPVLIQQMSRRGGVAPGGGAFIETYIAPDMHMRPVGQTVAMLEEAGLEVRDVHVMREHYVRTIRAWHDQFEKSWDEAVALVGESTARVWRIYMVGSALAFEENRMGVDQILSVRPAVDGDSGMPPTRDGWAPA